MHIDPFSLQCLLAIVETGSFTKAARRLHRTQSAISQKINQLEEYFGFKLLNRDKNATPTDRGKIVLQYANEILSLYAEMTDRLKEPELEGEIAFGLPEDFTSLFLSDILIDFKRIHPRIAVKVSCDLTLNLYERYKQGEFDLVLVKMSRINEFPNNRAVWSEQLVWVGNDRLADSNCDFPTPIPLVLAPEPCVYRSRALEALSKLNISWKMAFCSPSYAGKVAAVKAGLGITVMPRKMIPADLKQIHHKIFPKLNDTHLCLLQKKENNAALTTFEHFITEKLKQS